MPENDNGGIAPEDIQIALTRHATIYELTDEERRIMARLTHAGLVVSKGEHARLKMINEQLRKDAERYRWLKANHLQTGKDSWIRTGDDLEEAIDKAMP